MAFLPKLHSNENHEKIVKLCLHFFLLLIFDEKTCQISDLNFRAKTELFEKYLFEFSCIKSRFWPQNNTKIVIQNLQKLSRVAVWKKKLIAIFFQSCNFGFYDMYLNALKKALNIRFTKTCLGSHNKFRNTYCGNPYL